MGKNITLILLLLISLIPGYGNAHHQPTEATPEVEIIRQHHYPSDVIYGFVDGCYVAFEDQKFMSDDLWPPDLKEICGCVMDSIRETVPLQEFIKDWNGKLTPEQNAMSESTYFPKGTAILTRKSYCFLDSVKYSFNDFMLNFLITLRAFLPVLPVALIRKFCHHTNTLYLFLLQGSELGLMRRMMKTT